jgi:hypothetical protein
LSNGSARRVYLWQVLMRESCNPIPEAMLVSRA